MMRKHDLTKKKTMTETKTKAMTMTNTKTQKMQYASQLARTNKHQVDFKDYMYKDRIARKTTKKQIKDKDLFKDKGLL